MPPESQKRVLIDLQHPAHLHFFRPAAQVLRERGHEVLFTARDKDILLQLGEELGEDLVVFGRAGKGVWAMGRELMYRQWKLWGHISRFKPDVMLAIAGTFIALPGWLRRVPRYVFYDTEHATISNLLAYPFATRVYVPQCYRDPIRWAHHRYNGYHELAYLRPDRFTPDPTVLAEAGIQEGERFSLVRFVGWEAAHDIGLTGFSPAARVEAVKELAKRGRVLLSAEGAIPKELEPYRVSIRLSRMHHLIAHADLVFGESATMCSEGAVLGVPGSREVLTVWCIGLLPNRRPRPLPRAVPCWMRRIRKNIGPRAGAWSLIR